MAFCCGEVAGAKFTCAIFYAFPLYLHTFPCLGVQFVCTFTWLFVVCEALRMIFDVIFVCPEAYFWYLLWRVGRERKVLVIFHSFLRGTRMYLHFCETLHMHFYLVIPCLRGALYAFLKVFACLAFGCGVVARNKEAFVILYTSLYAVSMFLHVWGTLCMHLYVVICL